MRVSVIIPTHEWLRLENQEVKASWVYTAGPVQKEHQSQVGEWGGERQGRDTSTQVIDWSLEHTTSTGPSKGPLICIPEISREGRDKDFLWTPIVNYGCLTMLDPQVTWTWVAAAPSGLLRRNTS